MKSVLDLVDRFIADADKSSRGSMADSNVQEARQWRAAHSALQSLRTELSRLFDGRLPYGARDYIEGMSVSIDVSTCEDDAGYRYFGTVTEVMDDPDAKHGVTLLVQDAQPNFEAPAAQDEREALAERVLRVLDDADYPREDLSLDDVRLLALLAARAPQAAAEGQVYHLSTEEQAVMKRALLKSATVLPEPQLTPQAAPAPQPEAAEPVAAPVQPAADRAGIELAARWVQKRLDDFTSEHGIADPDTGAVEFGRGARAQAQEEYVDELMTIVDGIRALATPPVESVERDAADARRYRWLRDAAPGEIVFDSTVDEGGNRFELYIPFDGRPIGNDEESARALDAAIDAALAGHKEQQP